MTKLTKPITRECRYTELDGRPAVVTIVPGDVIRIHAKGSPHKLDVPLDAIIWQAVRARAKRAAAEKKKARQLRRLGAI
jgi:hypothetical protein